MKKKSWKEWLWDLWCLCSIIGIWPRYIEPKILLTTKISFPINHLPNPFKGFKILQISDLHWDNQFSKLLLKKLKNKIIKLNPDIIVFTGDLINRSKIENKDALKKFLNTLKAPFGTYAILGNHDYATFVTLNSLGDYDVDNSKVEPDVQKGFRRLFSRIRINKRITEQARSVQLNSDLIALLNESGFKLLANETVQIEKEGSVINLTGLEEYITGRINPDQAFQNYQKHLPGIVLVHNPDAIALLQHYPGDLILSGHTHGGEVNLPWMWKKFCALENPSLKKGLKHLHGKTLFINRGITSILKFRWFAPPELTLIKLESYA